MRGGLGGGRRFELLGEGPGGVPLWIVNMFLGGCYEIYDIYNLFL